MCTVFKFFILILFHRYVGFYFILCRSEYGEPSQASDNCKRTTSEEDGSTGRSWKARRGSATEDRGGTGTGVGAEAVGRVRVVNTSC